MGQPVRGLLQRHADKIFNARYRYLDFWSILEYASSPHFL